MDIPKKRLRPERAGCTIGNSFGLLYASRALELVWIELRSKVIEGLCLLVHRLLKGSVLHIGNQMRTGWERRDDGRERCHLFQDLIVNTCRIRQMRCDIAGKGADQIVLAQMWGWMLPVRRAG